MLSRNLLTGQRRLAALMRPAAVRSMSAHYGEHHKSATQVALEHKSRLSDLPLPEGSWQEHHSKRNATYNMVLAGGIVAFITTVVIMKQTGTLYLHGRPDLKNVKIDPTIPKTT